MQYSSSRSQESLPIPLPTIQEPPEVTAAIETHTAALVSQLTSPSSTSPGAGANGSRGEIVVQLYDRKRRKTGITGGWLGRFGAHQTEEEICWEEWVVQVVVARPRTEAGRSTRPIECKRTDRVLTERIKMRRAMESSLQKAAMKIVTIANKEKDHIPPILTSDQNPFPYQILVNPKQQQSLDRGFGAWA